MGSNLRFPNRSALKSRFDAVARPSGTESSNPLPSSGESANRRSLARSGSLQSTLPAQAPSWGLLSALRLVHSAGVTRIALLTKRRFSVGSAQTQPRVIFTARDRRPTPIHRQTGRPWPIPHAIELAVRYLLSQANNESREGRWKAL
jgi:hypothetical protein